MKRLDYRIDKRIKRQYTNNMPKTITKVSTKDTQKSYQIRVNITPELYKEIQKTKNNEFRFLDDAEIIKIFLSKGSQKINHNMDEPTEEELTRNFAQVMQLDEDWNVEPDNINYSKATKFDPKRYFNSQLPNQNV